MPRPSHSLAPSGPEACAFPPTVFWNLRSQVPMGTPAAEMCSVTYPPRTRPEFSLNGSVSKSGSPSGSVTTSNQTSPADPAPIGSLTTKQWNAMACPAVARASVAIASRAITLRRMCLLVSPTPDDDPPEHGLLLGLSMVQQPPAVGQATVVTKARVR